MADFEQLAVHLFVLLGSKHQLGTDVLVKVLLAESLELHSTLLKSDTLLVSVLGDLGGHVVANDGVQAGHEHQTKKIVNSVQGIKRNRLLKG